MIHFCQDELLILLAALPGAMMVLRWARAILGWMWRTAFDPPDTYVEVRKDHH